MLGLMGVKVQWVQARMPTRIHASEEILSLLDKCLVLFKCGIKLLHSSILHVCTHIRYILFALSVCSLSFSGHGSKKARENKQKKKCNMKWKCMTTALGSKRDSMVGTIFGCVHVYVCETYRQEHFSQNQNEVGELDRTFLPSPKWKWLAHIRRGTYGVWSEAIRWRRGERNACEPEEMTGK